MKHLRKIVVLGGLAVLGGVSAQAQCFAEPAGTLRPAFVLSAADKQHILTDHFVVVRTVREMPAPVSLSLLGKHPSQEMADAGGDFEVGNVVSSRHPRFLRLIYAAISPGYCLVYYEHGGISHGSQVCAYRWAAGKAVKIWSAPLDWKPGKDSISKDRFFSLPQLQKQVVAGKFYKYAYPQ